ncbi:MAG: hypothetical protein P1P84_02305 [Deferrisomatales bacterium]|nr:hypothetical protein [Deferrisomatales bacterium]
MPELQHRHRLIAPLLRRCPVGRLLPFCLLLFGVAAPAPGSMPAAGPTWSGAVRRGSVWRGPFLCGLLLLGLATPTPGAILAADETWSGAVRVEEDLLVPPGRTLTILSGTRVTFAEAPSTKTEPVFWNPGTELAVAGRLVIGAAGQAPVVFDGDGPWGGVVAAPGGQVTLVNVRLAGAEEALLCVGAGCELTDVVVEGGEYGLVLGPGARFEAREVTVRGARVGVLDARGMPGSLPPPTGVTLEDLADAGLLRVPAEERAVSPVAPVTAAPDPGERVEFVGEYTVARDETWRGQVVLAGRVTVVPEAVLTLAPGTRVLFRKRDSNGDGLGEGELLVLGGIRSRGLPGSPVVFASAEEAPAPGDWDKVSLIASEDPDNHFAYTVFRHGVQALHAHFSRFVATDCFFAENLRAVQFQESEGSTVRRSVFVGNKQALRFRDSRVEVRGNVLLDNWYAVHAFRCTLEFVDNVVEGTALGGFLAKESEVWFTGNRVLRGRDGLRLKSPDSRAEITGNLLGGFAEDALSLSQVAGTVSGNRLDGAGLDLISVEDAAPRISGNQLAGAGRHAVHLKGASDLDARGNHWGGTDPGSVIHDREDDPQLGAVLWQPALAAPPQLSVPDRNW